MMNRLLWPLVKKLSRLLESDDREAVLGDFAESNVSASTALRDLWGLILGKQVAVWMEWRAWLALLGIVGPVTAMLFHSSLSLGRTVELYLWILGNYQHIDPALLEETGYTLRRGIVTALPQALLVGVWAWTGGFVLATLSRRALWVNSLMLCGAAAWLVSLAGTAVNPPELWVLLGVLAVLFLPLLWGMRQGMRLESLPTQPAVCLAVTVILAAASGNFAGGWWSGRWSTPQFLAALALCWPALYIVGKASHRSRAEAGRA